MTILFKGVTHHNCKISKCGKYYIASNNFTKFKVSKCILIN